MSDLALHLIRENIEKNKRGEDATFLDFSNCGMTELPKEIGDCEWLVELNLIGNKLLTDLTPLTKLIKLQHIDCSFSQVRDLSPLLHLIKKGVPVKWKQDTEKGILVEDCPLICPPIEVVQESPQAVRDYFEELGGDSQKLNEVKVIFLGEASSGKTSLVKRLLGDSFDSKESQTHGIRIRKKPFAMDNGDTVIAHLWDFGGQEVMHATHQFFLSQRSVYVLLLNSRNDDQAEKWLKHAASFGGQSPVLVVLNKMDENPSFEVNRKALAERYPQIHDFFRVSAKTDTGIEDFGEALRREIDRADNRRTPFPVHWLAVKEHFANMTSDYIESVEYRKVCEENGVTRQFSQDVLLQFLHDLGVVINFRSLKNFDTQILNPLWLTNGVYRIINSEIVVNTGGLLREDDFEAVINDARYRKENTTERSFEYPKNKLQYIVRVMQQFELCFMLDARTYVVPQLLPVIEPDFKVEGAKLRFVTHFPDFMPYSIFPRLMVKLHTYIENSEVGNSSNRLAIWRTGMVLHKPSAFKALARIQWDREDQKILVDVYGEDRRRFLSFIRETVKEIASDFSNLNFDELIQVPGTNELVDYQMLVEIEKAGEKELFVKQLKKRIPIADLLDGVEESTMRDEVEQIPIKAFVSYSHIDSEYLKDLRSALAPLIRLQKLQLWDDRDIDAGDEWDKVILQQLAESDIVLCLISADFVASDFCFKKEFASALEAHRRGEKSIIPIMLRRTDWQDLPLAQIQGIPGEWISSSVDRDSAWTNVAQSIRPAIDRAKKTKHGKAGIRQKKMLHDLPNIALERIVENKSTRALELDLSSCDLTVFPNEISDFIWLQRLDIHNNEMLSDLSPLSKLTTLQEINLSSTQVSDLSPLIDLEYLKHLNISSTQIKDLKQLSRLSNLEYLDISHTKVDDLSQLSKLVYLRKLFLNNSQVHTLSEIASLVKLQYIDISGNKIMDLSPLSNLKNLQQINCSNIQLPELLWIKSLSELLQCNCSNTFISDLSPLSGLKKLQQLNCSGTQVHDLKPLSNLLDLNDINFKNTRIGNLSPLSNLTALKKIEVSYTLIKDLSPLSGLINLEEIAFEKTQVTDLSPLSRLTSLIHFNARDCSIENCPADVYESGNARQLRSWYATPLIDESIKYEVDNRRDVKLILLGNSNTGKTNLVHFLEKGGYLGSRHSTHGLEVHRWLPNTERFPELKNVAVSIWDFGGQEYYHGAYRLFMSDNAVYLLLWCTESDSNGSSLAHLRDGDKKVPIEHFGITYWLDTIRHYGGSAQNAPILVVQNKTDDPDIDKIRISQPLHQLYGIRESLHISLRDGCTIENPRQYRLLYHFVDELAHLLATEADRIESRSDWSYIRDEVISIHEGKSTNVFKPHIEVDGSVTITNFVIACEHLLGRPLSEDDIFTLPRWLHRGGCAVFFPDLPGLNNRIFLRPDELANNIYNVLNKKVLKFGGIFDPNKIFRGDNKFKDVFMAVAQKLRLIFPHPDVINKPKYFIAPQYLPSSHPIEDLFKIAAHGAWESAYWIRIPLFYYKKLLHGLILEYAADSEAEARHFWKHGIVFLKKNLRVLIKGMYNPNDSEKEGLLIIGVESRLKEEQTRLQREIFQKCIELLQTREDKISILSDEQRNSIITEEGYLLTLEPVLHSEHIELIDKRNNFDVWAHLDVSCDGKKFVNYLELYKAAKSGEAKVRLESGEMLIVRLFENLLPFTAPRAKRVFLSYSHQNSHWLGRLRTHLAGLRRSKDVETWTDQEILPGDPWDNKIRENLQTADVFILLLSADFIASDYIWDIELTTIFEKLKERKALVIPILVEPLDLGGLPNITHDKDGKGMKINDFQITPSDENNRLKAISLWTNTEEALAKVALGIREAIKKKEM